MNLPANYLEIDQRSPEWFKWRLGVVGASRVKDAIAVLKRKDGESEARRALRFELAVERLTGKTAEHFVSEYMQQGIDREPLARTEYENATGRTVESIGFVLHPTIKMAGASPDGLVGEDGLLEIKCPKTTTHLKYIVEDTVPDEYLPQVLWQLACTERQWVDFVSYDLDLPEPYGLFIKRLERNDEVNSVIRGMEIAVDQFLSEVDLLLLNLKARNRAALHEVTA